MTTVRKGQLWLFREGRDMCLMLILARNPDDTRGDEWLTYEVWNDGTVLFSGDCETAMLADYDGACVYTLISDCPGSEG